MILSGASIKRLDIVMPCEKRTVAFGLTYGLGPAGYDVRVEFDATGEIQTKEIQPGEFMLASTIEYFDVPQDVLFTVHDKSTWARRGLVVQNTVGEPGWTGYLTLELTNHGRLPIMLHRGMPIAQVLFHRCEWETVPYDGKYQNQKRGPVPHKGEW